MDLTTRILRYGKQLAITVALPVSVLAVGAGSTVVHATPTEDSDVGSGNATDPRVVHIGGTLVVDGVIVYRGNTELHAGAIRFTRNGEIRHEGGGVLEVYANSITAESGAIAQFRGVGAPGAAGGSGAPCDADGGQCQPWRTWDGRPYDEAACIPENLGHSGHDGERGGRGPRILVVSPSHEVVDCQSVGGAGGAGGPGGHGRRLIYMTGGEPNRDCPAGGGGTAGGTGEPGVCEIRPTR